MFQRKREFLPWYRQPGYRGKMAEEQKRQLDDIRDRGPHPAVRYEQLPGEAQGYIIELELQAYDAKQQALAGHTLLLSVIGALLIDANFFHLLDLTNSWTAIVAVPLLVCPWLFYVWQWRRNADEYIPPHGPDSTDEKLREAWELDYIAKRRPRGD